jgi:hypothetical protein
VVLVALVALVEKGAQVVLVEPVVLEEKVALVALVAQVALVALVVPAAQAAQAAQAERVARRL